MKVRDQLRQAGLAASPVLFKNAVFALWRVFPTMVGGRELLILPALVSPNRAAVDVGMHHGLFGVFLERLVGSELLYGFEPVPDKIPDLERMFPRANVRCAALSDRTGQATIWVPMVDGRLRTSRATLGPSSLGSKTISNVPTTRLDDLRETGVINDIGFMKIDVEGHERSVLRGANGVLKTCRPNLIVEIEERHGAGRVAQTFADLSSLGYATYFISPADGKLCPASSFSVRIHQNPVYHGTARYVANFVSVPEQEADATLFKAGELLSGRKPAAIVVREMRNTRESSVPFTLHRMSAVLEAMSVQIGMLTSNT